MANAALKNKDYSDRKLLVREVSPNQSHRGPQLIASSIGWPDRKKFDRSLIEFFKDPKNFKFFGNMAWETQELKQACGDVQARAYKDFGHFEDAFIGIYNIFRNLKDILQFPDIRDFRSKRPGILISAGPSLDREWENLKKAYETDHFVIVAVDAVFHDCVKRGIYPDFVFSTERMGKSHFFFETEIAKKALLEKKTIPVFSHVCDLRVTQQECFRAYAVRDDYNRNFFGWHNRAKVLAFPSVAPTALACMAEMEIETIALVGQDVCYKKVDKGLMGYADLSVPEFEEWKTPLTDILNLVEIEANILTEPEQAMRFASGTWRQFKYHLEETIAHYRLRVINSSFDGARICGAPYGSLSDFIKWHTPSSDANISSQKITLVEDFKSRSVIEKKYIKNKIKKIYKDVCEGKFNSLSPEYFLYKSELSPLVQSAMTESFVAYEANLWEEPENEKEILKEFQEVQRRALDSVKKCLESTGFVDLKTS